jgi:acetylornithine deacetylase/succinyl-diaminopimelate desuccinylase-like protein
VTLAPTMITASQKINVIPSRAELQVDCRVPPGLGEEEVLSAVRAKLGSDGYEIRFEDEVSGNRSPVETPLMDFIRGFVERTDPGAGVVPVVLTGFSDSHWWRAAFPDCLAYGFYPRRVMDAFDAFSLVHGADERVAVEDLGLAATFYAELMVETLR